MCINYAFEELCEWVVVEGIYIHIQMLYHTVLYLYHLVP